MKEINQSIGPVSLEQIVRFSGAVQDFNPIHYDERFARDAGLPGVIAQGPLTYLVTLDALIAANGAGKIDGFAARLKAPVVPGVALSVACTPDGKVTLRAGEAEALVGTITHAKGAPR